MISEHYLHIINVAYFIFFIKKKTKYIIIFSKFKVL